MLLLPVLSAVSASAVTGSVTLVGWGAPEGAGLAWTATGEVGGAGFLVDRSTDGGTTWTRLDDGSGVVGGNPFRYADLTATGPARYRVTPELVVDTPLTDLAATTGVLTPLTGWSGPAPSPVVSVDGYRPAAPEDVLVEPLRVVAWPAAARPGLDIGTALPWQIGTTTGTVAAWTGPTGGSAVPVVGRLVVARAVLHADGTPAELAAYVEGTREEDGTSRGVRAVVLVGATGTGLPGYLAPVSGGRVTGVKPVRSDWDLPVTLRNLGGTAVTLGTPVVTSLGVVPAMPTPWQAQARCTGVAGVHPVVAAGADCGASVHGVLDPALFPTADVAWPDGTGGTAHAVIEVTWPDDRFAPSLSLDGPVEVVRRDAAVTFVTDDPQGDEVSVSCRLDTGPFVPCTSPLELTALTHGTHRLTAFGTDPGGSSSSWESVVVRADGRGPVTTMTSPGPGVPVRDGLVVDVGWRSVDEPAGVATEALRRRTAGPRQGYGAAVALPPSRAGGVGVRTVAGVEQCFSARASDQVGNVGAWSGWRCFVTPLDDRALVASGRVERVVGFAEAEAFRGTRSELRGRGASVRLDGLHARQVGVLVERCRGCGSVDVYLGGARLGRLATAATRTSAPTVLWLPRWTRERTGTLRLVAASRSLVLVDGIVVRHS